MKIATLIMNPFQECCYVVSDFAADPQACFIVDCGAYGADDCAAIDRYIEREALRPVAHLLTHAHLDHVFGARHLRERYGLLPMMDSADEPLLSRVPEQARMFGVPLSETPLSEYIPLPQEQGGVRRLMVEGVRIEVIATPGHTPGGVCYRIGDTLFSGDTLFCMGYGRTDLPGGDYLTLMASLARLNQLPPATQVYPGHGRPTTIGDESLG